MKKLVAIVASIIAALSFMTVPVYARDDACNYYKDSSNKDIICGNHSESDAEQMVGKIIQTVFMIVGIIAVIVIIIGGIMYATSQGDSGKLTTAKNTILYAAIGLIISLLSFAIVSFILTAMEGDSGKKEDEQSQEEQRTEKGDKKE
jgi:lysylphosphatidylglycerol synthetase-like protein (DUF2156 family)